MRRAIVILAAILLFVSSPVVAAKPASGASCVMPNPIVAPAGFDIAATGLAPDSQYTFKLHFTAISGSLIINFVSSADGTLTPHFSGSEGLQGRVSATFTPQNRSHPKASCSSVII